MSNIEIINSDISTLFLIQQKLIATKDKKNDFGKFKYRNAEGILEHLKPILKEVKAVIMINEDI